MAGSILAEQENRKASDILFDLTPEDDKQLRESDLLDLVNYGQLQEPIQVLGTNGKQYTVEMAILWDEDHIDLLKKTTQYSSDALLRVRVMRRLKLHKSIQSIDDRDYSDESNIPAQRELWAILSRMSDAQIEYLDAKYSEKEMLRNMHVMEAIEQLSDIKKPAPQEPVIKEEPEAPSQEEPVDDPHTKLFKEHSKGREKQEAELANAFSEAVEGTTKPKADDTIDNEGTVDVPSVGSPKQQPYTS